MKLPKKSSVEWFLFLTLGVCCGLGIANLFRVPLGKLEGRKVKTFPWEGAISAIPEDRRDEYFEARLKLESEDREESWAAFHLIRELEEPYRHRERSFIDDAALSRDRVKQIIEEYSVKIKRLPIHNLMKKFNLPFASGIESYVEKTKNKNAEFYYPVSLDSELDMSCSQYAFFFMRGENPTPFVDPLGAWEPLGTLIAQGYEPVNAQQAEENDVVVYLIYHPNSPNGPTVTEEIKDGERITVHSSDYMVQCCHFGVVRKGAVTSKDLWGQIAHHSIEAGGRPGWRYMVFRKPYEAEHEVPEWGTLSDWYETELCMVREKFAYPIGFELSPFFVLGCGFAGGVILPSIAHRLNLLSS